MTDDDRDVERVDDVRIEHAIEGTLGSVTDRCLTNGGNGRRDVFHVAFDQGSEDVAEVVVRSVAVIHNAEPTELPPLGESVDPDALADLFSRGFEAPADVQVTFVYEDLEITVNSDGDVWLEWV